MLPVDPWPEAGGLVGAVIEYYLVAEGLIEQGGKPNGGVSFPLPAVDYLALQAVLDFFKLGLQLLAAGAVPCLILWM